MRLAKGAVFSGKEHNSELMKLAGTFGDSMNVSLAWYDAGNLERVLDILKELEVRELLRKHVAKISKTHRELGMLSEQYCSQDESRRNHVYNSG